MSSSTTSKPGRFGIEDSINLYWFKPGYWRTLGKLRATRHPQITFDGFGLHFAGYPFEPATVFTSGTVKPDEVAEVNLGPVSRVRLKNGDIALVPGSGKAALIAFINQHDVRLENRGSVWGGLLDPFLDTWEEQQTIDRQFAWFAALGLARDAVDRWRREVAAPMIAYNFGTHLWEWTSLDLYDVLTAQRANLSRTAFADFYSRAIRLAALDPVSPLWKPTADSIAGALFSVLIEWYPRKKGNLANFDERQEARRRDIESLRQKLAAELSSAYGEAHRRYHTLGHIHNCLEELTTIWNYAVHIEEVRWALLFHDAIYDPHRQDNEARSADWACRIMDELRCPEDAKARVRRMILATAHSGEPSTPDEALLLDIDLSILGADEAAFDEYDRAIREEYSWVPQGHYRQERAKVLESFLRRERIYGTAPYRARYEARARANLERALARLRNG